MDCQLLSTHELKQIRQSMVRWLAYGQPKMAGFDEQLEAIDAELARRGCV